MKRNIVGIFATTLLKTYILFRLERLLNSLYKIIFVLLSDLKKNTQRLQKIQ